MLDSKLKVCYVSWEAPTLSSKLTPLFCVSVINEWEFLLHVSGCALSVFGVLCSNLLWLSLLTDKRWLEYIFILFYAIFYFLGWIICWGRWPIFLKIELFCYFWILFIPCVLHIITFYQIYFFLFCDLSLYYLTNIFHWAESFNESRKSVISFTEHVIIVSKVFHQTSEFPDSILLGMSWSFLHLPLWLVIANICVFVSSPFIKRT